MVKTASDEVPQPVVPLFAGLEDGAVVMTVPTSRRIYSKEGVLLHRPRMGVRLRYLTEGEIVLSDGRIAGGDLLNDELNRVFSRRVESGTYPALTIYADASSDSVAAFGVIRFSDEPAKECFLALFEGEDPSRVSSDMAGGLGTDSGTVALGDPEVGASKAAADQAARLCQGVDIGCASDAKRRIVSGPSGGTACVWHAGFGDGQNTPYWGIGRNGRLCFLAVDFNVVANGLRAPAVPWTSIGESLQLRPKNWWNRLWR